MKLTEEQKQNARGWLFLFEEICNMTKSTGFGLGSEDKYFQYKKGDYYKLLKLENEQLSEGVQINES